ncbi:unnamed protein product, partial [Adineta steineri]
RTAEVNSNSNISSSSSSMKTFSPQTKTDTDCSDITIPHDVYIIDGADLAFRNHRHDQNFSESKSLRDLERKTFLVYTNRYLITNVSLKDVRLDFTIYKQILEGTAIRYRLQNDNNFQSLLVRIINDDDDGNDCETHCSLCIYGKKCTYRLKCKYFHIERRHQNLLSITESLQMKARLEKSKIQHYLSTPTMINNNGFNHTKSGPEHLHMYSSPIMD